MIVSEVNLKKKDGKAILKLRSHAVKEALFLFFSFKESKFESLDVESEKASEKTEDEEDNDSVTEDKKDESDDEMERDSGDEAVSDSGERSQSEREEPTTSMKEFLLDRAGIGGAESVPGSPASQMSQG